MAARQVVARLQGVLAPTIESLRRVSPLADADVTSVRDFHADELPTPNIDLLRDISFIPQPWWARIAPPLAGRATERGVWRRAGYEIRDVVRFHDRQVQSWLKTNVAPIVELYEAAGRGLSRADQAAWSRIHGGRHRRSRRRSGIGGRPERARREETDTVVSSRRPGMVQATYAHGLMCRCDG